MIETRVSNEVVKPDPMKPRIESRKEGVFLVTPKADKETGEIINHEQWLSNAIKRITKGVNDLNQEYLIIEWGITMFRQYRQAI